MASVALGFFLGGCVVAIPVVTGVAEGVEHQKKQNEEAANETRMIKFNVLTSCDADDDLADEVDNGMVVVRHDKLWILPREEKLGKPYPVPPEDDIDPPLHALAAFYIQYPDDDRSPPERGLVSTISDDPPMLNWIYMDIDTYELRYGNRSTSITHVVGDWDWTEDESAVSLEGWEGFVAVDESDGLTDEEWEATPWGKEGLRWAVYFDRDDNALAGKRKRKRGKGEKSMFEVIFHRKLQSEEDQLKQQEEADKKMQVKTQGQMTSQFTAPSAENRKNAWKKKK